MAVAMFMHWPGVTSEQYDGLMKTLDLDRNPAPGSVLHMAAVTEDGLEVTDVWQTEQAFRSFFEQRLLPVVSELQFEGEPDVKLVPLHNLFAADGDVIDRIGMLSIPAGVAGWSV